MRVLIVQGSLGTPSRTAALTDLAGRILAGWGHDAEVFDLRCHDLSGGMSPLRNGVLGGGSASQRELVSAAGAADAFVLATPVYHNSYSGVLKFALDHLSQAEFADKPVALCGDGGQRGSEQPLEHLRTVLRSLHAVVTPSVVTTRSGDFVRVDGDYVVDNQKIAARTRRVCHQLLTFADLLRRGHGLAITVPGYPDDVF